MKRNGIIRFEFNSKDINIDQLARKIYKFMWPLTGKFKVNTLEIQDIDGEYKQFRVRRKEK